MFILCLWSVFALKDEPFKIESTPLEAPPIPFETPSVSSLGTVTFAGQEEPLPVSAAGASVVTTTPSPYVTIPVVFEYSLSPWTSALEKVDVDTTVDAAVDALPDLRALVSYLRAQKATY